MLKDCPLQSLAERDKQTRKQVVEEIRKLAKNEFEFVVCDECYNTICDDVYITSVSLNKILDQVKRRDEVE